MPTAYTVKAGDCLSSIAVKFGMLPETVWNDSANQQLRNKRKDSHVLFPGDILQIPDIRKRQESVSTDAKYRFNRKAVPEVLKIQLLLKGKPRENLDYQLDIDGKILKGKTNAKGELQEPIPPDASSARLIISKQGDDESDEVYDLTLGHIDPIEETKGAQERLANLSYYFGSVDGKLGESTESAVKAFQEHEGLDPSGKLDDKTKQKLEAAYGA